MLKRIKDEMHLYEKKVLKALEAKEGESRPEKMLPLLGLDIKAVMSAAGALNSKNIIKVDKDVDELISLSDDGEAFAKDGLPERRILLTLKDNESIHMKDLSSQVQIEPSDAKIGIGWLMKKGWATLDKGEIKITKDGKESLEKYGPDELLIRELHQKGKIKLEKLSPEQIEGYKLLKQRKGLLKINKKADYSLKLTPLGEQILSDGIVIREEATQITHEQLKSGSWSKLHYRSYDINAENPEIFAGKLHPLQKTIEDIRRIFLNLGFTESRGTILESAFWNFDCLFQPQDHAAREMQDTFYIKNPKETLLPEADLVERVRDTHEHGGQTGSEGWKYRWAEDIARQSVLRTHTTCVSARFLKDNTPPLKMFSVGRVFRRETITYKHLPEFHQVEGIVAADGINFRNLLGILKEFYYQLGFEVRFRPAYFPYTYLSTECEIYLPEKESWIELGGAGMFRPEVLEPLGVKTPVAAFGLGIERLAMIQLGIKDIRMLYQSDVGWLRTLPVTERI